jgi:hypothetical protein
VADSFSEHLGGCCYNCERVALGLPCGPELPAKDKRVKTSFRDAKEKHAKEIEKSVSAGLEAWRSEAWRRDYGPGSSFRPTSLMSDKAITSIMKHTATLTVVENFQVLTPPWPLWMRYGEEVLQLIDEVRDKVLEPYRKIQEEIDRRKKWEDEIVRSEKLRRAAEAEKRRQKNKEEAEKKEKEKRNKAEARRKEQEKRKEIEMSQKEERLREDTVRKWRQSVSDHNEKKRKVREWEEKRDRGERVRGRAPKGPAGATPEPPDFLKQSL